MSAIDTPVPAERFRAPEELRGVGGRALAVGAVAAVATAAGAFLDADAFFRAYLVAWLLWLTVATGSLGLLLIHHLSGGRWGLVLRRPMEAAARTLPVIGLLSLPLFFGLDRLFLWADHARVEGDHVLHHKAAYLNPIAFTARSVVALALFSLFAFLLARRSAAQDVEGDRGKAWSMQKIAGVGLLVFVIVMSFLGFDWLMSLDPYWFSSLYGAIFLAGAAIASLTFLIVVASWLVRREPMAAVYTAKRFHDFGTLLFAFVMFFTYLCISQFIIAYQGNLPEEVVWFRERFHGYWAGVAVALLVFHFFFPFLILLHRSVKKKAATLARIALFVLFMRWVDLIWQSRPTFVHEGMPVTWIDAAATLAVGGIWIWSFARALASRPLLPVGDPALGEVLGHE
ncbi:MAG: hypothetical protein F9K16_12100 [Thermoanaerobaculia bacterium]|nr:MAG: hypothetical protein F9K16_12100 [Thermoanaerobaculia bacterium]